MTSEPIGSLSAALALEVDGLCDDFERHWRRARRRNAPLPPADAFVARASPAARPVLRQCLRDLEAELAAGTGLPEIPGLVLEEEIGRGGMGVVYRARRAEDGRLVALKLIPRAEHARWTRWIEELADLHHPNLVPFERFGAHDGLHFLVMPFVPGGDLRERFDEFALAPGGRSGLAAVAGLTRKVAGAVAFLHARGILHRDLKPSNILLASPHGREPLVCDFGLAGRLGESGAEPPWVAGTPSYVAPEQMEGRALTAAADVWSLGAVLYELLTLRPPFARGRDRAALPPCPRELNPAVDGPLERICLRCLAHDAAGRYATADELAEDLDRYLAS